MPFVLYFREKLIKNIPPGRSLYAVLLAAMPQNGILKLRRERTCGDPFEQVR